MFRSNNRFSEQAITYQIPVAYTTKDNEKTGREIEILLEARRAMLYAEISQRFYEQKYYIVKPLF